MALRVQGAKYLNRSHVSGKDANLRDALDDLASQVQFIRQQGQFSDTGTVSPPSAPTSLSVTAQNSLFTVQITHNNAPSGTRWRLQYSPDPNFKQNVIEDEFPVTTWQRYLPGQRLYFRVAAKFSASALTNWVYFGNSASPTAIS